MHLTKKRAAALAVALTLALALSTVFAACASDPEVIVPDSTIEPAAGDTPTAEPGTDEGIAPDSSGSPTGDLAVPSGFPTSMPIPRNASSVQESVAYQEGWATHVPNTPFSDVISEMETAFEAIGWNVLQRTDDVAWEGDRLFVVENSGQEWHVYVEPAAGSEEDTLVTYFQPE